MLTFTGLFLLGKLTQNIDLKQIERSGSILSFNKGEEIHCPGPDMETEYQSIPVQGISPMIEVGLKLEPNCRLKLIVKNN